MAKRGPKPSLMNELGAGAVSKTDNKVSKLMHALAEEAMNRGQGPAELANEIGISYPYLTTLMHGKKPASALNLKTLKTIATYLKVPEIKVLAWAGIINKDSFFCEETHPARIWGDDEYSTLWRYASWGALLPETREEFNKAPKWCREILLAQLELETGISFLGRPKEDGLESGQEKAPKTAKTVTKPAKKVAKPAKKAAK
jgi:hypothetical protein